jgi:pyruvate dehydrogenase E2 component (dihydrolipoamide acetyltransferase)
MAFEFILPDIGEGVVEAEIQQWFVKPGDEVGEDQPLVEVMTDKATVTIPSPRRGRVLRLHYREGEVAKVHQPLLEMEVGPATEVEASALPMPPRPAEASPDRHERIEARPPPPAGTHQRRSLATPAVRAMARQLGIDVNALHGTGPGGRVTRGDLDQAGNGHEMGEGRAPAPQPATGEVAHGDEVVPFRGIRRRIAERMAQSKRTAAHFTFVEEVDVSELVKLKDRVAAAARADGVKITFLPFVVKAVVAALKKHPWLNATLDEARGEIRLRREYHIGIASATEQGLVVPVVHHADRLSLVALAAEIERLSSESKAGRSRPADMTGSTFSITSLGAMGGLFATPIINYPEVAILGVHRIRPIPVVRDGQIVARDVMYLSLSLDHRVVDGHVGAAFAYAVIRYLEDPSLLFMEMI